MKMGIGIFIGILLIVGGIGIILNILFDINLPVFKIMFALFFIYLGLNLFFGDLKAISIHPGDNASIFGETHFKGFPKDNEYTVIFGYAKIDISEEDSASLPGILEINTIFGGCDLIIDPNHPVKIKGDVAFGSAELPGKKESAFGTVTYKSLGYDEGKNALKIEANTIFGKFQTFER